MSAPPSEAGGVQAISAKSGPQSRMSGWPHGSGGSGRDRFVKLMFLGGRELGPSARAVIMLTPRVPHEDVVAGHLSGVGGPDLVDGPHPEAILVPRRKVLHLDLPVSAAGRVRHLGPGAGAAGRVQRLHDVLLDVGAAVVLGGGPVHHAVVLEDVVRAHVERRGGHVHDVDVDELLVLALGVLHHHLVGAGLLALWVDNVQLNPVAVDGELREKEKIIVSYITYSPGT